MSHTNHPLEYFSKMYQVEMTYPSRDISNRAVRNSSMTSAIAMASFTSRTMASSVEVSSTNA
eukprot:1178047-Prorocentrum_minimum.AAC.5